MRKISLYLLIALYIGAGINHFWHADFYYPIIPPYLQQWALAINICAGIFEIIFGVGMIFVATRKWASYGIMLMLVVFLPVHIYFVQVNSCIDGSLCTAPLVGWLRLLLQPVLIWWAWVCGKFDALRYANRHKAG